MALFRRTPEIDYDKLAKALSPAIAAAGGSPAQAISTPGGSTYALQTAGGTPESPLPRPGSAFDSQFGPGYPLIPDPLDPPGPNGRTAPRRSQFLVAWNLQLIDREVPWTMLRWLAEDCDVVNRCIQLTQDEQCGLNWGWTFSDQILQQIMTDTGETNTAKAASLARDKYGDELTRVQQFFEYPDQDMNQSFTDWLQALLWDHLVYDGVSIYPRFNLDKTLRNLELVDASTIKLYRDNRGRIPQPPAPAYAQILYGFPRGEFQHTVDEADDEYMLDQLAYFIRRPRNTSVYGYPQVEEVMALATTYLARQAWMRAEYTSGAIPKAFMRVNDGGQWTPEQYNQFEQGLNDRLTGQIDRRQMVFLLREGMDPIFAPQLEEHYKSDYDNWLIGQIASRFGRPPSMLGVQAKAGLSGGKQMEGEMSQSDIYSGKALSRWLVQVQNNLARRFLGVGPEITATYSGGQTDDAAQETAADVAMVNAGLDTRNGRRAVRGMPLIDEPEADQLAITTGTGVVFLAGLLEAQKTQQEAAPAAVTQPGQPAPGTPSETPEPGATPEAPPVAEVAPPVAPEAAKSRDDTPSKAEDTERLRTYWAEGEGAAKIGWGSDGDFDRCRVQLAKYVEPGELDGECANLHHRATGAWPGHAPGESESKKAEGGLPKVLRDRKTVEKRIADYYTPKLTAALKALHPGAVSAARKLVAQKAAVDADAPTLDIAPQTDQLNDALTAMYTDAWVAGVFHATQGTHGDQIAATADPVTLVDYDDWQPGWAETATISDPPDALAALLDGVPDRSTALAGGQMTRITNAAANASTARQAGDDVAAVTMDPDYATEVALNETANGAETAAMAAYQEAGIDSWDWVLDSPTACALCQSRADDNPHSFDDDQPPAHSHCECGSQPHDGEG